MQKIANRLQRQQGNQKIDADVRAPRNRQKECDDGTNIDEQRSQARSGKVHRWHAVRKHQQAAALPEVRRREASRRFSKRPIVISRSAWARVLQLKSANTRCKPAAPMRRARSPFFRSKSRRSATSLGLPGSTKKPVFPSRTASAVPPDLPPITGLPTAFASVNTMPKLSTSPPASRRFTMMKTSQRL